MFDTSLFRWFKLNLVLLLLILLPFIFFHKIIFNFDSMFFPSHDIVSIFSQEKQLFNSTIKNYQTLPLWNPYVFSGSPFLGNPTSAMFYPINLLFLIIPVDLSFGYVFIVDTFLIGLFTFFFGKSIGMEKFSAFLSSVTLMFSGSMLTLIFPGHLVNLDTFIWFPLLLFFYEKAIKSKNFIFSVFAGFCIALMLLAGASQIAVYSLLASSIYFFLRLIFGIPKTKKIIYLKIPILIFIVSIILGFLLSSIQLLPTFEFSNLSARSEGLSYEFASDFSLHPFQTISFLLPYFFGSPANGTYWGKGNFWSLNGYVGILPLLLASIALLFRKNRLSFIFLILGLFSLLFSFGKYTPAFTFFYNYVPGFDSFRAPSRFLYIYTFSICILTGIGFEVLIKKLSNQINQVWNKILSFTFLTGIIIISFSIFFLTNKDLSMYKKIILNNSYAVGIDHSLIYSYLIDNLITLSLILLIFSILLFLKIKNKINNNLFKFLIIVIVFLDLLTFHSKIITVRKVDDVYFTPELIKKFKNDKDIFRIFDMEGTILPLIEKHNLESITGVHSLYIGDYRDFVLSIGIYKDKPYESFFEIEDIKQQVFLNLLNVKYIISNKPLYSKNLKLISELKNVRINYSEKIQKKLFLYLNENFLPRAFIVPNAIILPKSKIINKLKEENFDVKKQIVLQTNPNIPLQNSSSFREVKIVRREPNRIELKVSLDNPGFLVLSEIDYPGWKAYDNNKEVKIHNSNYIMRSIYLSDGKHNVYFSYEPASYKLGQMITLTSLSLCFLYALYQLNLIDLKRLFR